jgi:hypothetical protein
VKERKRKTKYCNELILKTSHVFWPLGVKINGRGVLGQNKHKSSSGTYGQSRVVIQYRATPERIDIVGPTTANVEIDVGYTYLKTVTLFKM